MRTTILSIVISVSTLAPSAAQQRTDQNFQSGYAPVNGLKLYYEIHQPEKLAAEAVPLVLLHGSFMTIDMNWSQLMPELSKTRKVIAVEMQGHGRTADIDRTFTYPALASDVAGLLKHLNIDRADILGYSLGGTVAFQLAIQNPELVNRLVLVSTVFKYDGWMPEVTNMIRTFQANSFDNTPLHTEYARLAPDTSYWHTFMGKMLQFEHQEFDLGAENIKTIESPALLVMGDNDGVEWEHIGEMYRALGGGVFGDVAGLPKSWLAVIPCSTHVSLMMQTDKLAAIITPFLDNADSAPQAGHH